MNIFLKRALQLPKSKSFFLFGARNTGKSTLLRQLYKKGTYFVDLLNPDTEERYSLNPASFKQEILALDTSITHVVIDEIQKLPKLLDIIHQLMESTNLTFIMTGSSAKKLRHGGANLLAGRAFVYNLHPFTSIEIGKNFNLKDVLHWGALPSIVSQHTEESEKADFLRAYAQIYLKEEIWLEHFIRKLTPFRKFLEVAAQCNGEIINFANIARDVGVDDKTIKQYFSILEDTLMGFMLEPYAASFRKRLHSKPKFYFFDVGVCRSLTRMLTVPLRKGSTDYGKTFEHFIILECLRLANYYYPDYRFSYMKTVSGVEVDLIVGRPGQKPLFIEIKSTENVSVEKISAFSNLLKDVNTYEAICISQDPNPKKINNVLVLPWFEALKKYFVKG